MDPDIVEDKPYLEPTQLEMNQIVERTLKKLGIEDIAKREKDTKMEEKLEQIIAEKFDKMGLNNDDDDDEEDNLAPFRKGKKASRIEKRVQKAVAGIENKLYANTFGQLNIRHPTISLKFSQNHAINVIQTVHKRVSFRSVGKSYPNGALSAIIFQHCAIIIRIATSGRKLLGLGFCPAAGLYICKSNIHL